jgi:hypothetical protein
MDISACIVYPLFHVVLNTALLFIFHSCTESGRNTNFLTSVAPEIRSHLMTSIKLQRVLNQALRRPGLEPEHLTSICSRI